jgi:acrylyl-CoA reductase (NADPH)
MFKALLLEKSDAGVAADVRELEESSLPSEANSVLISVAYSTVNYKDALAITNRGAVVRKWPMVPGIDGAGVVLESIHPRWSVGDQVLLNGFGVGETHWGCLSQRARLSSDWLIALPEPLSARDAMAIGTAGYTAMLSVLALEDAGLKPGADPVLVTGASGGVGSFSIAILASRGYRVVASTGKAKEEAYLTALGASEVIDRAALGAPGKPLQKERYAAVIDSVGSHTLANACAQTRYGGLIAACGLAQGMDFPASVAPFILRAVKLIGIDSVMASIAQRERAWRDLAGSITPLTLQAIAPTTVGLAGTKDAALALMEGRVRGRVVVDLNQG